MGIKANTLRYRSERAGEIIVGSEIRAALDELENENSEQSRVAADCPNARLVLLQTAIRALRDLPQVQCRIYDPYMHGTVDGMLFALSLLEVGESKYSDALAERLKDRLSPEKAGEASAT